jgi:metal-responsive CopG/Arc/MetJ family transcriptional regulator
MFGVKISLDDDLYEKVKKCAEAAGYSSPEEFVAHVLEKEVEKILGPGGGNEESDEIIKKRLQGLGYIE